MTEDSMWTTGRMSLQENAKFVSLMEKAMRALTEGKLLQHDDPLIHLETKIVGSTGHVFYSWKFPPKEHWSKETKTKKECLNCLPHGINGNAKRQAWCLQSDYEELKCPYGVLTKGRVCPLRY